MGWHDCDIPDAGYIHSRKESFFRRKSNGDVQLQIGTTTYQFPVGIAYYLCDCGWQPPQAFIDAVMAYKGPKLWAMQCLGAGDRPGHTPHTPESIAQMRREQETDFVEEVVMYKETYGVNHKLVHVGYLLPDETNKAAEKPQWNSSTPFKEFLFKLFAIAPILNKENQTGSWLTASWLSTICPIVEKGREQKLARQPSAPVASYLEQLQARVDGTGDSGRASPGRHG